jgi:hypothetical protein
MNAGTDDGTVVSGGKENRFIVVSSAYLHCATASGICRAIHAITVQEISIQAITRSVIPIPFAAAGSRRRRPTAISARTERGYLAGNADRQGASGPKVDGRAAHRQLQGSGRQARDQAAAHHLPSCADGMIAGGGENASWNLVALICVPAGYVERSAFSSNVGVPKCQRRTRISILSMTAAPCCDGWFLPGSVFLRSSCFGASD